MSDPPFDPWALPLLHRVHELDGMLFPKLLRRVVLVSVSSRVLRQEGSLSWRAPGLLLAQLRKVNSDAALNKWLLSRSMKEIASAHWWVTNFVNQLHAMPRDSPAWGHAKKLLGRNPTRLRLLLASLKFCCARNSSVNQ